MDKIAILNIPNYISSYYLKGLTEVGNVRYEPNQEFQKFNGTPFLIFRFKSKIIIIDNRDPIGVQKDLYEESYSYYVTNKLKTREDYNQSKIKALFPHYPLNLSLAYFKYFGSFWIQKMGFENVLKDLYRQNQRPIYKPLTKAKLQENYIFFSGSIWQKEKEANLQRAEFVKACKQHKEIIFEGGLIPRADGNDLGFDTVLGPKRYTYKDFANRSARSLINFSNPAVLGAVSWRFAEFLNMETFVLSLPWQIELPVDPKHGKEIHMISDLEELPGIIEYVIRNPIYHQQIAKGGKAYFNKYCEPKAQIKRIITEI